MRIIAGNFKGKKILIPKDKKTRPLKDLTKESIFNIINHSNKFQVNLKNANVLDLFSGVGSFGIECLSRGANKVIFIENYNNSCNSKGLLDSEDLIGLILFLISDKSKYINGQNIIIDDGWSL